MKVTAVIGVLLLGHLTVAQFEQEASETAVYEVIKEGEGYEERMYPPAAWVCHESSGLSSARASKDSFFALFRYITGSNDAGKKIPMTAPVTMFRGNTPSGSSMMQMCFYIPEAHQLNPPAPTEEGVYVEDRPPLRIMASRFGGFVWKENQWALQAKLLKQTLEGAAETNVNYNGFYSVGYDSPMKWEDRRNEIWYVMKN
ncbi:hypothetical protein Pcinc_033157 [Petrolisthes cinctipes]|uniref:Heme-binding protein 2 n=1 Tax=Petrolisthes cinctipes TaxID=88211 RepID=A0AAE1ESV0_PETCI|nr:hypothetical protein Pcinc_033157 [Petrolisthes cinctipes]